MNERINPLGEIDRIMGEFQDRMPVEMVRRRIRKVQDSLKSGCKKDWRNFEIDLLGGYRRRLNDKFLNEFFESFGIKSKVQSIRYRKTCIVDGKKQDVLKVLAIETNLTGVTLGFWQHLRSRTNPYPWVRVTAILNDNAKAASISPTLPPLSTLFINEVKV